MNTPPDNHDFERELADFVALYKQLPAEAPGQHIDDAILAQSRRAVGAGPRRSWLRPQLFGGLGLAAALVVAIGVAVRLPDRNEIEAPTEAALADQAARGSVAAGPATVAGGTSGNERAEAREGSTRSTPVAKSRADTDNTTTTTAAPVPQAITSQAAPGTADDTMSAGLAAQADEAEQDGAQMRVQPPEVAPVEAHEEVVAASPAAAPARDQPKAFADSGIADSAAHRETAGQLRDGGEQTETMTEAAPASSSIAPAVTAPATLGQAAKPTARSSEDEAGSRSEPPADARTDTPEAFSDVRRTDTSADRSAEKRKLELRGRSAQPDSTRTRERGASPRPLSEPEDTAAGYAGHDNAPMMDATEADSSAASAEGTEEPRQRPVPTTRSGSERKQSGGRLTDAESSPAQALPATEPALLRELRRLVADGKPEQARTLLKRWRTERGPLRLPRDLRNALE
jgi:hypothetical protein